jgi:hypothetical protein
MFVSAAGLNTTLHAAANDVALQSERPHIFVGVYATATDAGLAIGPLLAYSVGILLNWNALYLLTGGALLLAVLIYWRLARSTAVSITNGGRSSAVIGDDSWNSAFPMVANT